MKLRRLLGRGEPDGDGADGDDVARAVGGPDLEATSTDADGAAGDDTAPSASDGAETAAADDGLEVADRGSDDEAAGDGEAGSASSPVDADGPDRTEDGAEATAADAEGQDGEGGEGEGGDDEDGPQQMAFELADWGSRERKMLDDQLGALRVARAWEASTLVVDASNADVVDDLIDEIEERVALDLGPDVETVTYEVADWPDGLEDRFIEALIEARVPHQRGYREIAVGVDREEEVDTLVEELTAAWEEEQPDEEELAGPDAQELLSELFVTADRLLHDASDGGATVRFDDAATHLEQVGLPFGFGEDDWLDVTARVATLRDLLADAESTDEQITEAARDLRTRLRPLV